MGELRTKLVGELLPSIVVFLVALPLCMGISIASGAPPALGLISGIIGGIVVGLLAGSPLQVSGPAAGLAVIVWDLIQTYGLNGMALCALVGGLLQVAAGAAGLGRWFRAASPAVINGMLAGIGILIFASQFHVMMDDKPAGSGLINIVTIPKAVLQGVLPLDGTSRHLAAFIGILTIGLIVSWNRLKPKALKPVPGPLVGVMVATVVAFVFGFPIKLVEVPDNLFATISFPTLETLSLLAQPSFLGAAVGLCAVASAESMLCATAVDRLHTGPRTNYNRELMAQGIGNTLCGLIGALPVTGVIVRSSANVEAGGKTRWSAVLHGVWILGLVVLLPSLLGLIPTAALAAILVYTGWRLAHPSLFKKFYRLGRGEFLIFMATVTTIVTVDLLSGVVLGVLLTMARGLWRISHIDVHLEHYDDRVDVRLAGAATFMTLPMLMDDLEAIDPHKDVDVHIGDLLHIDHACLEALETWGEQRPGDVKLDWEHVRHTHTQPLTESYKGGEEVRKLRAS